MDNDTDWKATAEEAWAKDARWESFLRNMCDALGIEKPEQCSNPEPGEWEKRVLAGVEEMRTKAMALMLEIQQLTLQRDLAQKQANTFAHEMRGAEKDACVASAIAREFDRRMMIERARAEKAETMLAKVKP